MKADYQELEESNLLTRAKAHKNCLKQVKHVLARAKVEVDLSAVGIFKKVRGGAIVGVPDPEGENEDSESSDEETAGEENEDNQAGNAEQGNEASDADQDKVAGNNEGDADTAP